MSTLLAALAVREDERLGLLLIAIMTMALVFGGVVMVYDHFKESKE